MNTIRTAARRYRSLVSFGVATVAIVAGTTMTAACGTDPTSSNGPDAPVDARLYPPTDVPWVRPGPTDADADAGDRHAAQNEESQRLTPGRPPIR